MTKDKPDKEKPPKKPSSSDPNKPKQPSSNDGTPFQRGA